MPVGHTCTHIVQSMQSPSPSAALASTPRLATAPGFAAFFIVGDDQRVFVEHGALEPRIRAHVLADLFAHEAGVAVGRESVEQHPEQFPAVAGKAQQIAGKLTGRYEVTDERKAR